VKTSKRIQTIILLLCLCAYAHAGAEGVRWLPETADTYRITRPIDPREATMYVDSLLYVCDYPYYVYYPDPRTGPQYHMYTYDGEKHNFYDWDDSLGSVIAMNIETRILPAPEADLPSVLTMCQDGSTVTIPLTIISGRPDTFLIDYSPDMAARIGRRWDSGPIRPGTNEIVLHDFPLMGVGHNFIYLSLGQVPNPLETKACMTTLAYMDLNFELGGYLHQKYGRMLFIDNNPENGIIPAGRKLVFTAYRWFRNGHAIDGATEQYYTEDGKLLKGEYYAEVTATDGITYKTCPIVLYGEEEEAEVVKCWRNGQLLLLKDGVYYNLLGEKVEMGD